MSWSEQNLSLIWIICLIGLIFEKSEFFFYIFNKAYFAGNLSGHNLVEKKYLEEMNYNLITIYLSLIFVFIHLINYG